MFRFPTTGSGEEQRVNCTPGNSLNLALALSIMLYTAALAAAPFVLPLKSQFFRPMVNGRILFFARLLDIERFPSCR